MNRKAQVMIWGLSVLLLALWPVMGLAQQNKPNKKEQPVKKEQPAQKTAADDGGLDFTQGDLVNQTIGPIKAEADKPQVMLMPSRIAPEFKTYEMTERSFVHEVLNTATHQQLHKKFKRKTFKIEVNETGNE